MGPEPARPLSIVLVDDHPMIRDILRLACADQPDLSVVGEAADGEEAILLCARLRPDVLVLDLTLPRQDGFEVTRWLLSSALETRVLILSGSGDGDVALEALRSGASGYLDKSA